MGEASDVAAEPAPNQLSTEQIAAGWISLFDGETLFGWTPTTELDSLLAVVVRDVGWRATDTGAPPTEHDIRSGWHLATNLLRALNLLSTGGGWQDRSYGLTPAGRAVALECLHHRATGPRSSPWG